MRQSVNKPFQYVLEYPGSGRTIILLHGFLASKEYWNKVSQLLSKQGHRVIAIDLVGFGRAPKPRDIRYNYNDHLQHIHKVIDTLGAHDFILAGHSMGALLAMRYTSIYPGEVSQLALFNPPMYKDKHQLYTTLRDTGRVYKLLLDSRYRHIVWIILRTVGPFSNHTRYSREGSLRNVINLAYFFEDLDSLTVPTLLVVGKKDRQIYFKNLLEKSLRANITVVVGEAGHHTPRTDVEFVVGQIQSLT